MFFLKLIELCDLNYFLLKYKRTNSSYFEEKYFFLFFGTRLIENFYIWIGGKKETFSRQCFFGEWKKVTDFSKMI